MGQDVDAALATVLRRLEDGAPFSLAWLQQAFPRHWERIHQSLALLSQLEGSGSDGLDRESVGGWQLGQVIGSGAFGTVYRARRGNEEACIKVLHPELATRRAGLRRFLREARIGALVDDSHVVKVYEADTCSLAGCRTAWLRMEYIEGRTLADVLDNEGALSDDACRTIGRQIALGLAAVHAAGAVHRDLKPHNVLLAPDGTAKLTDLGVAWAGDVVGPGGGFAGTLRYAAPEQIGESEQPPAPSLDVYALGALLFELATGEPYRTADTVGAVVVQATGGHDASARRAWSGVTPFLDAVIRTLLAPMPEDRFESAGVVATVLEQGESGAWWREQAGRKGAPPLPSLLADARRTPLYGRRDELALLVDALDRSRAEAVTILVDGEDGIGKSRLVAELGARACAGGRDVTALSLADEVEPEDALRRALGRAAEADLVAEVRGRTGIVLVVEDLHLATAAGRALFSALAEGLKDVPSLLIGTQCRPANDPWTVYATTLGGAERLPLTRLTDADARHFLHCVFGGAGDPAGVAAAIEASGGLPITLLAEGRRTADRSRAVSVTRVAEQFAADVPRPILEAVHLSLQTLAPADGELLCAAACCGRRFSSADAAVAAGRDPDAVRADLDRLAEAGAHVVWREDGFAFQHVLIGRALHALADDSARRRAHVRLAEHLAATAGGEDRLDDGARVRFTRHLLGAHQPERAAPHVVKVAPRLPEIVGGTEAVRFCREALAFEELATGRVAAWLARSLSAAAVLDGDDETARAAAHRAIEAARAVGDPVLVVQCMSAAIHQAIEFQKPDEAMPIAHEMRRIASACGDGKGLLHAIRWIGKAAVGLGDVDAARERISDFEAVAQGPAADAEPRAGILAAEQWAELARHQGLHDEEERRLNEGIRLATQQGDAFALGVMRRRLLPALTNLGRLRESMPGLTDTLEREPTLLGPKGAAYYHCLLGFARAWCGDLAGAEPRLRSAAAVYRRLGATGALVWCEEIRATAVSRLGSARRGYRLARSALRLSRQVDYEGALGTMLLSTAAAAYRSDFPATAARLARMAERLLARAGKVASCAAAKVWLLLAVGSPADASQRLRRELPRLVGVERHMLAHAVWRASGVADDLALARELAEAFLDRCPDDLRAHARRHAPEIAEVLDADEL